MSTHVLISNSSETQGKLLKHILQSNGFDVTLKTDFWESLKILEDGKTDLIILKSLITYKGNKVENTYIFQYNPM